MGRYALCFLVLPASVGFASGWNDYDTRLIGSYRLVRCNADEIAIWKDQTGQVVPPKIVALNVHGEFVLGKSDKILPPWKTSTPGFFILNTKTDTVQVGLDEQTWLAEIKSVGIRRVPVLRRPSRFFMWRRLISNWTRPWMLVCVVLALLAILHATRCRDRPKGYSARFDYG